MSKRRASSPGSDSARRNSSSRIVILMALACGNTSSSFTWKRSPEVRSRRCTPETPSYPPTMPSSSVWSLSRRMARCSSWAESGAGGRKKGAEAASQRDTPSDLVQVEVLRCRNAILMPPAAWVKPTPDTVNPMMRSRSGSPGRRTCRAEAYVPGSALERRVEPAYIRIAAKTARCAATMRSSASWLGSSDHSPRSEVPSQHDAVAARLHVDAEATLGCRGSASEGAVVHFRLGHEHGQLSLERDHRLIVEEVARAQPGAVDHERFIQLHQFAGLP